MKPKAWRQYLIAAISGFVASLSHPWSVPIISNQHGYILDYWWQGLIAYFAFAPLFVQLAQAERSRRVFGLSFVAGFVYFYSCIYWVNVAIILYGGLGWGISLFAVTSLVVALTLFWSVVLALGHFITRRLGWNFLLLLPLFWATHEYLRNYLFTGFPWVQVGYSQARILPILQTAALWGVYGVGMLVIGVNTVWAAIWLARKGKIKWNRTYTLYTGAIAIAVVFSLIYGAARLYFNDYLEARSPHIKVAILQGNINQDIKNRASLHSDFILSRYQALVKEANSAKVHLFVWPEASYPHLLPADLTDASEVLGIDFPLSGYTLLGAAVIFRERLPERVLANSVFLLSPSGKVLDRHDKTHLVPFGEYVPLKKVFSLFGVRKIVRAMGNFTPGKSGHLLKFKVRTPPRGDIEVRVGVLVCYEGIFPEISRKFAQEGANLFVNVTNDAWYGISSAPYQHLYMYAFRSVENRKPTVRAANTGISAVIDISGRMHEPTELYQTTWRMQEVPVVDTSTLYTKIGDVAGWAPTGFTILSLGWALFKKRRGRNG